MRGAVVVLVLACAGCAAPVGRYTTTRDRAGRVWRLDTQTGKVCMLLAPRSDFFSGDGCPEGIPTSE